MLFFLYRVASNLLTTTYLALLALKSFFILSLILCSISKMAASIISAVWPSNSSAWMATLSLWPGNLSAWVATSSLWLGSSAAYVVITFRVDCGSYIACSEEITRFLCSMVIT